MNVDKNEIESIMFKAQFGKITTTVDGGWSVTLLCGQQEKEAIMKLSSYRNTALSVGMVPYSDGPGDFSLDQILGDEPITIEEDE